ncbi:hypothetical protein [Cellulomonas fengjieae]|uniref:hypothetical protein n=1 Tax=Cellulomonas fengjieae TaxID=2819978 RepID=UPI001AB00E97|nr:hypothetical protein [Cellulomonas fengjieae]MBO3100836.1 hypothetical protein [Cellulomonas fengjieae]
MNEVRPTLARAASDTHGTVPGVRRLTADELAHLDRARTYLRSSGTDVADAHAVGTLLHGARSGWAAGPPAPVPQAMVMALGVGVGDLVVARVPGARWALRTAGDAPTPAVVSASGQDAALPLADVAARWQAGCGPQWVAEYVAAAAAHLTPESGTEVPSPRTPPGAAVAAAAAPVFRTPADLPRPPSPAAQDIALGVLDQALEATLASGDGTAPFAVVDGSPTHGPDVRRFGGDPTQALRAARAWVRSTGAARAAVAWSGRLPGDDEPASVGQRAVLVEASDAGAPSLLVAHRYSAATSGGAGRARPARAVGEPLVLGQGDPLL